MSSDERPYALVWWEKLSDGDRRIWRDEAQSNDPLDCFRLYRNRGPRICDDGLLEISKGNCPLCHNRGFVIGPQGGAATNIECASVRCRERYNVVFYSGQALMGHKMGNASSGSPWPSDPGTLE